jgi:rhodanese-related sulfurtransferase
MKTPLFFPLFLVMIFFGTSVVAFANNTSFQVYLPNQLDTLPPDSIINGLPLEIDAFINEEIEFKVPVISCQQLRKLQVNGRQKLAILDARSKKAFNISHIEEARRVGFDDFSSEKVWFVDKNTIVVIYCSLGEKSEKIALELQKMGFNNIQNLYGSIIEWVNQDLPVVDKKGEATKKVYLMSKKERRLLKKSVY